MTSTNFQVAMAKVMEQGPVLVLTFMVQQIMILRDAVGNVIEGGEVSTLFGILNTYFDKTLKLRCVFTFLWWGTWWTNSLESSPDYVHCVVLLFKTLNSYSASLHPGV